MDLWASTCVSLVATLSTGERVVLIASKFSFSCYARLYIWDWFEFACCSLQWTVKSVVAKNFNINSNLLIPAITLAVALCFLVYLASDVVGFYSASSELLPQLLVVYIASVVFILQMASLHDVEDVSLDEAVFQFFKREFCILYACLYCCFFAIAFLEFSLHTSFFYVWCVEFI